MYICICIQYKCRSSPSAPSLTFTDNSHVAAPRPLARSLGAREPQICNGPEILDKFVGEAERRVRALFEPAEEEWATSGDDSVLSLNRPDLS